MNPKRTQILGGVIAAAAGLLIGYNTHLLLSGSFIFGAGSCAILDAVTPDAWKS